MIRLWTINRVLRWLGFVLVIECDGRPDGDPDRKPSRIGFVWTGWPPDRKWAEHCARSRLADSGPLEGEVLDAYRELHEQLEAELRPSVTGTYPDPETDR